MEIQLVVFDMAGTTVQDNNNVHLALQTALKKQNIQVGIEEINLVMGIPKPVAIQTLLKNKIDEILITDDFIDEIHRIFLAEMIDFYKNSPEVKAKEGAEFVFKKLRDKGIKVVLDTGFSRDIVDVIIERLQWKDKIDGSVASDEVAQGRPYPDLIFKAMELIEVKDAKSVAKVGDTASDLQEGNSAGCKYVIGITSGAFNREELAKEPHTHLIHHLEELMHIL